MTKIIKFPKRKSSYSDKFLSKVKPDAIGDFIKQQNPHLTIRAADAMALAIIYSTYLQLVFEEEGEPLSAPEQQEDGTYLLLVADHDTGEHKYITFGEGLTDDVRRQRGEDNPSPDDIRRQGAKRDNAVAKLSQSDDFQKKMDAAIEKSIQRDKEREKQRMQATGESYEPLGEEKDKKGKGSGTKDACYHKVKSRYSVWPSAYASGALVKCRQKGAANWGNSKKKD